MGYMEYVKVISLKSVFTGNEVYFAILAYFTGGGNVKGWARCDLNYIHFHRPADIMNGNHGERRNEKWPIQ